MGRATSQPAEHRLHALWLNASRVHSAAADLQLVQVMRSPTGPPGGRRGLSAGALAAHQRSTMCLHCYVSNLAAVVWYHAPHTSSQWTVSSQPVRALPLSTAIGHKCRNQHEPAVAAERPCLRSDCRQGCMCHGCRCVWVTLSVHTPQQL
jgi:hypothetical protein